MCLNWMIKWSSEICWRQHVFSRSWVALWEKLFKHPYTAMKLHPEHMQAFLSDSSVVPWSHRPEIPGLYCSFWQQACSLNRDKHLLHVPNEQKTTWEPSTDHDSPMTRVKWNLLMSATYEAWRCMKMLCYLNKNFDFIYEMDWIKKSQMQTF
jgi:hypothetical protein